MPEGWKPAASSTNGGNSGAPPMNVEKRAVQPMQVVNSAVPAPRGENAPVPPMRGENAGIPPMQGGSSVPTPNGASAHVQPMDGEDPVPSNGEILTQAKDACRHLLNGGSIAEAADLCEVMMAHAIGALVAKLILGGLIGNIDEIFLHLASVFDREGDGREEDLVLNRRAVLCYLRIKGFVPSDTSAREANHLGSLPTIGEIAWIVEKRTGVSLERIRSPSRVGKVIEARFLIIWTMRKVSGHSLAFIGERLGDRHHTSIMNAIERVRALRMEDDAWRKRVNEICDEADMIALRRFRAALTSLAENGRAC